MKKTVLLMIALLTVLTLLLPTVGCKDKEDDTVYTVTFDTAKYEFVTRPADQTVKSGDTVAEPVIDVQVSDGYAIYWWDSLTLEKYDFSQPVHRNLDLVMDHEALSYTISYDYPEWADFAQDAVFTSSYVAYTEVKLPFVDTTKIKKGYNDTGWRNKLTEEKIGYILEDDVFYGALELEWTYEYIQYGITYYNLDGAVNPNPAYYSVDMGTLPLQAPVAVGRTFSHWIWSDSSTSPKIGERVENIQFKTPFKQILLYAVWTD